MQAYKTGTSKTNGKAWAGWFCGDCKKVDWVRTQSAPQAQAQPQSDSSELIIKQLEDIHSVLTEIYKVEVAVYKESVKKNIKPIE